jgi:hypothetical protein
VRSKETNRRQDTNGLDLKEATGDRIQKVDLKETIGDGIQTD